MRWIYVFEVQRTFYNLNGEIHLVISPPIDRHGEFVIERVLLNIWGCTVNLICYSSGEAWLLSHKELVYPTWVKEKQGQLYHSWECVTGGRQTMKLCLMDVHRVS
jgi:hypothetical protein